MIGSATLGSGSCFCMGGLILIFLDPVARINQGYITSGPLILPRWDKATEPGWGKPSYHDSRFAIREL